MQVLLTNITFYNVAGIAQYLSNFIEYNEEFGYSKIIGVNVVNSGEPQYRSRKQKKYKFFRYANKTIYYPDLSFANEMSNRDLDVYRAAYKNIIEAYETEIRKVKPDIILVNGSYLLPWCLLQAARAYGRAKIIVHYHGILTKEIQHWSNQKHKANMRAMEKDFGSDDIFYIFPSMLTKKTVEREVFKNKIKNFIVLPNPVSGNFFQKRRSEVKDSVRRIGVVSRWSKIKNLDFIIELAKYNSKRNDSFEITLITDRISIKNNKDKLNKIINLRKPVCNNSLKKFYKSQGVILSASHFETYGNVAQESIACGTPAFINKNMGVVETFQKIGLDDYIINFDSPSGVLKKVAEIIERPVPSESIKTLYEEYSNKPIFKKYFEFLLQ